MKTKYIIYLSILISLISSSCNQNEMMDYALDGRVYFNETAKQGTTQYDIFTKSFSFALQSSTMTEYTMEIKVKLMGDVADYDRKFKATVVSEGTTAVEGEHFVLNEGVVKAGEYESVLPITLYRTSDTKDHTVKLYIKLDTTTDLAPGNPSNIYFELEWGDILVKPEHWPYYFGSYNVNKYQFAIDNLGITDWPQTDRVTTGHEEGKYTISEMQHFARLLNEAYEIYRTQYHPIYNDDMAIVKTEIHYSYDS